MLAARVDLAQLGRLPWEIVGFLLAVLAVRPAMVWASTLGTGMSWRDEVLASAVAGAPPAIDPEREWRATLRARRGATGRRRIGRGAAPRRRGA